MARKRMPRCSHLFKVGCSGMAVVVSEGWERNIFFDPCIFKQPRQYMETVSENQTKSNMLTCFPVSSVGLSFHIRYTDPVKKRAQSMTHLWSYRRQTQEDWELQARGGYVTHSWPACSTKWRPVSSYRRRRKRGRRKGARTSVVLPQHTVAVHLYFTETPACLSTGNTMIWSKRHSCLPLHLFCKHEREPRFSHLLSVTHDIKFEEGSTALPPSWGLQRS